MLERNPNCQPCFKACSPARAAGMSDEPSHPLSEATEHTWITAAKPFRRSATRSSIFSNPTLTRTENELRSASLPPKSRHLRSRWSLFGSDMLRCSMSDSTPPSEVAGCRRISIGKLELWGTAAYSEEG